MVDINKGVQHVTDKAPSTGGVVGTICEDVPEVIETSKQIVGDARDAFGTVGERVRQAAEHIPSRVSDTFQDFRGEMTTLVRRYPIPAVLAGFGIGMMMGRALRAS